MKINKVGLDTIHSLGNGNKVSRNTTELQPDVQIKISDLAKKISKIQDQIPEQEATRLDQLRSSIERGEYKINPERIATILLALEDQGQ